MSNQEVEVGQVYVGELTGTEYTVISVDSGSAELRFGEKVKRTGFESVKALVDGEIYKLKDDTSPLVEGVSIETTSLRDHFSGLAMQSLIPIYWDISREYDSAEALVKCLTEAAYEHADAMLKARGE